MPKEDFMRVLRRGGRKHSSGHALNPWCALEHQSSWQMHVHAQIPDPRQRPLICGSSLDFIGITELSQNCGSELVICHSLYWIQT